MQSYIRMTVLTLAGLWQTGAISGAIITVPPDLQPGDQYRLVFVSSTTRTAESTNINDYNEFVDRLAGSVPDLEELSASWKAIASTAGIDASANIGSGFVPIYRLDGKRVVNSTDDLWDGTMLNPILTELGTASASVVWTGTLPTGQRHPFFTLGTSTPVAGASSQLYRKWVFEQLADARESHSLYGISSVITIGHEVPEPPSVGLGGVSLLLLVLFRRMRSSAVPTYFGGTGWKYQRKKSAAKSATEFSAY
jgi:hypothetical protein